MIIQQISVFLENRAGRTAEVAKILAEANIDIQAYNIAESNDFGVFRLIVSDTEGAVIALKKAGLAVVLTTVLSASCPNTPGSLTKILDVLAGKSISVDYMYSYIHGDATQAIIRTKDIEACQAALIAAGIA